MLTLLTDADLYAPHHRGVCNVLVAGDRVVWVGPDRPSLDAGLDVAVLACDGRTVVPGLVDGHVHVTGGGGEGGPATSVPPPSIVSFTSVGVTTVVGLLGTDDLVRTPAQVHQRVLALRAEGLHAVMLTGGYHLPVATVTGRVETDVLHLAAVRGVGELAIGDHRGSVAAPEAVLDVAARVRTAGLLAGKPGTVHLHLGDDGVAALGALLDTAAARAPHLPPTLLHPTHVNRSADVLDGVLELVAGGVGPRLDVTAFPADPQDDAPDAAGALLALREAGRAWDTLTCSSDAGGSLPVFDADGRVERLGVGDAAGLLATVRALVAAGVPLAEALVPMTTAAADQLGLDDVGRLAPGSRADLLVLDDHLRPTDVLVGGRHHLRDGRQVVCGTYDDDGPT